MNIDEVLQNCNKDNYILKHSNRKFLGIVTLIVKCFSYCLKQMFGFAKFNPNQFLIEILTF